MRFLICTVLSIFMSASVAQASEINGDTGVDWVAHRDLSNSRFVELFEEYSEKGYRMTDVEAYPVGNNVRYAMVWQRNDDRGWAEYRNMTSDSYHQRWLEFRDRGYRPTDIEGYMKGNKLRFAGIWIENREGLGWSSWRNMTTEKYIERLIEMRDKNYLLVDMEVYDTPSGLRYSGIWYENVSDIPWVEHQEMSRDIYQQRVDEYSDRGYQMVDYERYQKHGKTRYAAIWHQSPTLTSRSIRTNRSENKYANWFRRYRDDGYRPVDFERDGSKYGAIWAQSNLVLATYQHQSELDNLLSNYHNTNDIAGISAAVVHNGEVVWQAGFGKTDGAANHEAHGRTVYKLASISKAVGGTLLGKLEETGIRQDGTSVSITAADQLWQHLSMLPKQYQQTLGQLVSHTGCIPHYNTTPSISNQSRHYDDQLTAALSIVDNGFVDDCTIGQTKNYSTHAFTYLGAAIEHTAGRTIQQLIRDEFSIPYQLSSLRMMYGPQGLTDDKNRSALFRGSGTTSGQDNSWKALGGGLESDAVDLARFGWLASAGEIVSTNFRDSNLMNRQLYSDHGYGWAIGREYGRRIASHGGSAVGARTQLITWPDDGLSIAIMSNKTGHDGLYSLAVEMGGLILGGSIERPMD